jgi:serine/threonine-protein kinase HipA
MNGYRVGSWELTAKGEQLLQYDEAWRQAPRARPLSLSLPLGAEGGVHHGAAVEAYFDNLLPDSRELRERVRSRFGLRTTEAFELLAAIGRDCVGAVQLLPEDAEPPDVRSIRGSALADARIAHILRGLRTGAMLGQRDADEFRISLAGAQEKTALLWHRGRWQRPLGSTPTTHIFKLPIGSAGLEQIDLSTSVENEWLCAQLVAGFGLPVAACAMRDFEEQRVLVVTRFDRQRSPDRSWIMRLPQEDLCQVFGIPAGLKYEADGGPGIARIMHLLLGSQAALEDRRIFFSAQLVFWMLAAIDGHAKNFSVRLEPAGRYRLAPLYDVLSAYPVLGKGRGKIPVQKLRMAMAVAGTKRHYEWQRMQRRHWIATAERCGIGSEADEILEDLVSRADKVVDAAQASLPRAFPAAVAEPILHGVRTAAKRLAQ